ncbi:hypothetical protein P280DRAFT_521783 [Massarina eburnea CBS 473.64]|uniref:Uncharacterized protein n=1 Tax=Massarina eburnea CBS 473.64 TaxID=1395130 RepID=A0A6A6RR46_9PLEO|nr:hypothetical protein P280DRAFT_521783 [Massarina eburnea CBS 473.64]
MPTIHRRFDGTHARGARGQGLQRGLSGRSKYQHLPIHNGRLSIRRRTYSVKFVPTDAIRIFRYARLYNKIGLQALKVRCNFELLNEEHDAEGKLVLYARHKYWLSPNQHESPRQVTTKGERALWCFEQCREIIAVMSPVLALFFHGRLVYLDEVWAAPNELPTVVAFFDVQANYTPQSMSGYHTMPRVTAGSKIWSHHRAGVVLDPTAPQFQKKQGHSRWATYRDEETKPLLPAFYSNFGDSYLSYHVKPSVQETTKLCVWLQIEAMIRTVNKAVCVAVKGVGGSAKLWDMGNVQFRRATKKIVAAVKKDLVVLQLEFDQAWLYTGCYNPAEAQRYLERLVRSRMSEEHLLVMAMMWKVMGY